MLQESECDDYIASDEDTADEKTDEPSYRYVYCPFNAAMVQKWCNRVAFRSLRFGCYTYADFLGAQLKRIVPKAKLPEDLKGKKGQWTLDRYATARTPGILGFAGSWEGAPDVKGDDPRLSHERISGPFRGMTVFGGPKALRLLARTGLGLKAVDIVNSHPVHIVGDMSLEEQTEIPELAAYAADRPACFKVLLAELNGHVMQQAALKQLVLSIIYGGGLQNQLMAHGYFGKPPRWLQALRACVHRHATELVRRFPDAYKTLVDMGKDQPGISLLSYHSLAAQCATTNKMEAPVSHGRVVSIERDCIVLSDKRDAVAVAMAASVPTTVEDYPSESVIVAMLKVKFPMVDFAEESDFDWKEFVDARTCCVLALEATIDKDDRKTFKTPANTTDFGLVISVRLEPYVLCGTGKAMEFWDTSKRYGRWRTVLQRETFMKKLVRKALLNEFRSVTHTWKDGKLHVEYKGQPPPQCKRKPFWMSVMDEVATSLQRAEPSVWLDGEHTRGWLMDRTGVLYSYEQDKFVVDTPAMRISKHMPWAFHPTGDITTPDAVWNVDSGFKAEMLRVLDGVFAYWLGGGKSLEEGDPFGLALGASLKNLIGSPRCRVWHMLMPMFEGNIDEVLWFLLHATADIMAWKRRCELRYMYGAANCGKDSWGMVMEGFLGHRDTGGLMVTFPKTYYVGFQKRTELDPILDSARHMDLVMVNEIPQHSYFCIEDTKDLCEARGVGITCRTIYATPEKWKPRGGVLMTSNHCMVLNQVQANDTGVQRRLNILKMRHGFTAVDAKDVKELAEKGLLNAELFWLTRAFARYLFKTPAAGSRLLPRPPRVIAETQLVLEAATGDPVREFIESETAGAPNYNKASDIGKVKAAIITYAGENNVALTNAQLMDRLAIHGVQEASNGSKRVLTFTYPNTRRARAIRLNSELVD